MGDPFFLIASLAMSFIQTMSANSALDAQSEAEANQANADIAELDRQRLEEQKIAAEKKSDRVREADAKVGSLVVAMADNGGAGTNNASRFAGEIGGNEGLDLARIEGNKRNKIAALHAQQTSRRNSALNFADSNAHKKTANTVKFFSSSLSAGQKAHERAADKEAARQGNT